jgi:GDPmannose 4,6-dehydratase
MKKKALITGITGQDGSYLAELLISKKYEVHGIIRRVALGDYNKRLWRLKNILKKIKLHSASLESYASLAIIIQKIRPDEIYHLAAQSYIDYAFKDEFSTMNTNINGTHHLLSIVKNFSPKSKFYFAGSSEMFGKATEIPQKETTRFYPRSTYGISKCAGYELTRNYREAYNLFCCSGILFNHESPRRGEEFVTRKITRAVANIKLRKQKYLMLGNIHSKRDWGHAKDYVKAMWLMLQKKKAEDFVVGTGKQYSVLEFVKIAFKSVNLNYKNFLKIDRKLLRPAEVDSLLADSTKAKKKLQWKPEIKFNEMIKEMVLSDIRNVQ